VLCAVMACGSRPESADSTVAAPGTTSVVPRVDSPRAAQEIYIDSVLPGNPLLVYGRARTFENTVQVRARDARGAVITEVFETSVGEMGNHNPYVARVWLVRDPGNQVTIDAFEYSAENGAVRSLTSKPVAITDTRMSVTLRFPTSDCTTTVAFKRDVPRTVAVARLLVEMLVAGPTESEKASGAISVFPAGSRVRSVVLRGGVLTADFNERLQNVGGACAAQAIRAAVTSTLGALTGVREVVITAAGSRELALQP
jgi:hypothetical protein